MLDIKTKQSVNRVNITGILNELEIDERMTNDGRPYVSGTAKVKVDQDVNGVMTENIIPIRMFSMKRKSDGSENMIYSNIVKMKEDYISLAAAESPDQATRVTISGARLEENSYVNKNNEISTTFQISSNFVKKASPDTKDEARFEMTGVIGNIVDEMDRNGDETGRLIVKMITIGYLGKAELITLIAENPIAVEHIRTHWEKGDTVSLTGVINMTYKVETWEEEQGFGEPIKRSKTVSRRELLITGGSPGGLDEDCSYDNDQIKIALDERLSRLNAMKEKKHSQPKKVSSVNDFGF